MRATSRASLAQALSRFDGGSDLSSAEQTGEGLYAVAAILDRESSLRRALTDPSAPADRRSALVRTLFGSQLAAAPLEAFADLAHASWNDPQDLRSAVETLAASAVLAGAERDGALDEVEDELFRFSRLLDREPQLRSALTDPALPDENKIGMVRSLLGDKAQPVTVRLVELTVTRPRGRSLEVALEELSRTAARRRQRLVAAVRVARALDESQQQRLAAALQRIYGRDVQLQVDVDPTVIGGVEVRVGDEVLDGTLSRRLDDVRRRLAGA